MRRSPATSARSSFSPTIPISTKTLPWFDVHAPLLSLPRLFGTNLANVPAQVPYLHADPELMRRWKDKLQAWSGFRVGIAWQGSAANRTDRQRSFPLAQLAPLAAVP